MNIQDIARWMRSHVNEHIDPKTGEVNCTSLVEAWDNSCADGEATLDPDHDAWDIAVRISFEVEARITELGKGNTFSLPRHYRSR